MLLLSCQNDRESPPESYDFYHWQTKLSVDDALLEKVSRSSSNRLYLRFFDLHVSGPHGPVLPIATVQIQPDLQSTIEELVPVVFIRNEVFKHTGLDNYKLRQLARKTGEKINRIRRKSLGNVLIPEVQFDCDWTDDTQEAFFRFLELYRQSEAFQELNAATANVQITSTLRLHQVKYRERTGVPPVDKVVLMAYNVGDIASAAESNSIINNQVTAQYLGRLKEYPLPYDVALPLFQWGVLYRNNQLLAVLRDLDPTAQRNAFKKLDNANFQVTQDAYVNNQFLYPNDRIRMETTSLDDLIELSSLIREASIPNTTYRTLFYEINSPLAHAFSHEELSRAVR